MSAEQSVQSGHAHTPQSTADAKQLSGSSSKLLPVYILGCWLLGLTQSTLIHTELCKVLQTWFYRLGGGSDSGSPKSHS